MKQKKTKLIKKIVSLGTAITLSLASIIVIPESPMVATAKTNEVTFERDAKTGEPIFDGNSNHLNAFVNLLLDDMSLENKAGYDIHIVTQYTKDNKTGEVTYPKYCKVTGTAKDGTKLDYVLPEGKGETDAVQGIYTDFPVMEGLGQSWNTNLIKKVGNVIGTERRGGLSNYEGMTTLYSAVADTRPNALSGRFEEDFSEDSSLVGDMVTVMGQGAEGTTDSNNKDGFWLRVGVGTKHYPNYAAEFFREYGSFFSSMRNLYENQLPGFKKASENNSIVGVMTTYGRTNGVPNAASPLMSYINKTNGKYTLWNVADCTGDNSLWCNCGNGINDSQNGVTGDSYSNDKEEAAALLILNGTTENSGFSVNISPEDVVAAVKKGIWGVTEKDLDNAIRGMLELFVREGCFNADADNDGNPDGYPFAKEALGENGYKTSADYKTASYQKSVSQKVAYDASEQSVVLLKNKNHTLPLNTSNYTADNKLTVVGSMANTRFRNGYATSSTPSSSVVAHADETPYEGITDVLGSADKTAFSTAGKIVSFKSFDGKYLTVKEGNEGGALTFEDKLTGDAAKRQQFEVYSWGMNGYSYLSLENKKWLKNVGFDKDNKEIKSGGFGPSTQTVDHTVLMNTGNESCKDSSTPYSFRVDNQSNGTVRLLTEAFSTSFGSPFETAYYSKAKVVYNNNDSVAQSNDTTYKNADSNMTIETVKDTGAEVKVTSNGTAIVVVGQPVAFSSGEGNERSDLALGEEQYQLVKNIADKFSKTIVILKVDAPVLMQDLQDNDKVDAIIFQPYAGQYDGYALANLIFGTNGATPSGHLTNTWYNTMDVYPVIDKYSLPEGEISSKTGKTYTLADIDPRYTIDMTNNDAIDTNLTYKYHSDENQVTYPFGYGLSYANFSYSNLSVSDKGIAGKTFKAKVDVKNNSKITASDVVQIYAQPKNNSAYNTAMYKKVLIGYARVTLKAGETKTVTVNCDSNSLQIYDVNSHKLIVESGKYKICLATSASSKAIVMSKTINMSGKKIATTKLSNISNVADHTYKTNSVTYEEVSRGTTAALNGGYYAVVSKGNDSYVAIPKVDFTGAKKATLSLASNSKGGTVELRKGSANGKLMASYTIGNTGNSINNILYTGSVNSSDKKVYENVKYVDVTKSLKSAAGVDDLYIVFKNADIRVSNIKFIKSK